MKTTMIACSSDFNYGGTELLKCLTRQRLVEDSKKSILWQ
jgi:hypothetical protein